SLGSSRELRTPTVERRLDGTHRGPDELRALLERIVEDVLEEHTRALLWRKPQHEVLDGTAERGLGRIDRGDDVGGRDPCLGLPSHPATPQEVDAPVVRDLEQPWRQRLAFVERLESSIRLEERLLDDVLAVKHRAGHARAVPVEARTQGSNR